MQIPFIQMMMFSDHALPFNILPLHPLPQIFHKTIANFINRWRKN